MLLHKFMAHNSELYSIWHLSKELRNMSRALEMDNNVRAFLSAGHRILLFGEERTALAYISLSIQPQQVHENYENLIRKILIFGPASNNAEPPQDGQYCTANYSPTRCSVQTAAHGNSQHTALPALDGFRTGFVFLSCSAILLFQR